MDKELILKLFINKKTNQISTTFPRSKIKIPDNSIPRNIKIRVKKIW
jgi:hypothetical protein